MSIKLNNKELKKILIENKIEATVKKTTRTSEDRFNDAIDTMNNEGPNDKIYFNTEYSVCILEFQNIAFISNNDLLRLDNRDIYKLKMGWHTRIKSLVSHVDLSKWEIMKSKKILIEFLYKTKNAQMYDPDAISSAFKFTLDGLVHAGLLIDDSLDNVPMIIPRQEKTKIENSLYIVLSACPEIDNFYTDAFKMVVNKQK